MSQHRARILDLGFILVLMGVATLFMFEVDVFHNQDGISRHQETIELDELLVLTTLMMLLVLYYTWRRAREHAHENARRLAAEHEIRQLAMHDPLTALPNRRQFDTALKAALQKAPPAPEAHAVLLLDLNGFKKINDIHGHPAGDEVLVLVAARLLGAMREGDMVARLGGDEFAVLARNVAGPEAAATIARRIIEALATPISAGRARHQVGTAIGIALSPQDGHGSEEIMRKADVALYRAKSERGSSLCFFEPEMDNHLRGREALEAALRQAVAGDAIALRFKPAIDGRTGRVTAFEALLEWHSAEHGEIAPDRFMSIAEDIGLAPALTLRLLGGACAAARLWPADIRLSVHISARQLLLPEFGSGLLAVLGETGLAPERLDLEIDEGILIRETDAAEAVLEPLRNAGIAITANHFGTGYADLRNLQRLRLDRIKIAPGFVSAMTHDRQAATMVKAFIGIGTDMAIRVSADGVMNEAQRAALAELGCHQIQGQRFGVPLDTQATLALLAQPPADIQPR